MLRGRERPQAQPQANQRTWEIFCREEAREAASAFLERVRRFKARHAAAIDVHDSTFTNEFSAAFLEESSILMASGGETVLPTTLSNGATFTRSLPSDNRSRVNGREPEGNRQSEGRSMSSGKSSWWSGLFKWPSKSKRSRERHSRESSSSSNSLAVPSRPHGGSAKQKKRGIRVVKETAVVQLLNLSEGDDGDGLNWSPCKLMLVQQQENYQIEIYSPPKVSPCQ
jgi:hypothetical protein